MADLKRTVLFDLHVGLGGKMVPFAGYEMPVQYPMGVMKEHLHTRAAAGLFDVSHMGQVLLSARSGRIEDAALALERLVPVDVLGLKEGRQRYAMFTNDAGGIRDDLMVANRGDHLFLVVNAACKDADFAHLQAHLTDCDLGMVSDRALLALQGPKAETALARLVPDVVDLAFMDVAIRQWDSAELWISRSGYTGEDGFEISVPEKFAKRLARTLLDMAEVELIGLGARDSLRLEAGMCLYGHDIDTATSPVEGNLTWAIQKVRRSGGAREGGFPGAARILGELRDEGRVMLVSTHNLGSVPRFCDRAILINRTVLTAGPTEEVFTQANLRKAFGGVLRRHVLGGADLHEDAETDTRSVTVLTDDERPFVIYGDDASGKSGKDKS